MWKFIVDVVHDFVSSLQPDFGRGFLHVSNVFLFMMPFVHPVYFECCSYCDFALMDFIHISQGYVMDIWLAQCQWSNPEKYGYMCDVNPPGTRHKQLI